MLYYPLDLHRSYSEDMDILKETLSTKVFDADEIPKFRDEFIPLGDSIRNSLWNIVILFIYNVIFFIAACASFLYREIK